MNIKDLNKKNSSEEDYKGVKFKFEKTQDKILKHRLLSELKRYCALFNEKGWAPIFEGGSSGNLSFRDKPDSDEFIITCGHTALRNEMPDEDFALVHDFSLSKNYVKASCKRPPSSESMMHGAIYEIRREVEAVFHGHASLFLKNAVNFNIPVTVCEQDYGTVELIHEMLAILGNHNFIILRNHGFLALGKSMKEVVDTIFEIEQMIYDKN